MVQFALKVVRKKLSLYIDANTYYLTMFNLLSNICLGGHLEFPPSGLSIDPKIFAGVKNTHTSCLSH